MTTQPHQPIDRLKDEARILGESRMIRDNTPTEQVTRDQAMAVFDRVLEFRKRTGITGRYIAKSLGVSPSVISQALKGIYPGNWQQIAIDLDRWLESELAREEKGTPAEFVWTEVAKEMLTIARMAVKLRGIGMVYGPAGVGKSLALRAVAEEMPGSIYYSCDTVSTSATALIDQIGRRVGVSSITYRASRETFNSVKQTLLGTPRLLIIDQIHRLCDHQADRALYTLCDLYDATGSPQLWVGTTDLVAYLERHEGRQGREPLSQIRSRITIAHDLTQRVNEGGNGGGGGEPLYTIDEIRQVFARNKIRLAPDAARYLMHLACLPDSGHLRYVVNVVQMASELYADEPQLTVEMLRAAQRLLVSSRSYTHVQERLEEHTRRPIAQVG